MNFCECGGEVDIRYGGHGAKFYAECRECGKTVYLKAANRSGAIQEWNNRNEEKTMNLIPKICEMLGVEIGEEFKLHWNGVEQTGIFRFTNYRLESKFRDEEDWDECSVLTELLNGGITIIKLPFEPKEGEKYWYVYVGDNELGHTTFTEANTNDLMRVYCGNCFRTEAEAQAHKQEIYEKLTGRKWEECDN